MKRKYPAAEAERLAALYAIEREYYGGDNDFVIGCDEAGRGPLAGPVTAAAVILPPHCQLPDLNDSKKLTEKRRYELEPQIKAAAVAWSVRCVENDEIDATDILTAALKAMSLAVDDLVAAGYAPAVVLIDGPHPLRRDDLPQRPVVKGDSLSASIAAASVLAKTERDRLMVAYDDVYPGYGFAQHKGYGTKAHREALAKLGFSPLHRRSFKVKNDA